MHSLRRLKPSLATFKTAFSRSASEDVTADRPQIAALLIDVSGNLHVGNEPTPGAVEAIQHLASAGFPFRLCSNTSKESTADLVHRLDSIGFDISGLQRALTDIPGTNRVGDEGRVRQPPRLVWTSIGAVAEALKAVGSANPYLILSDSAKAEVLSSLHRQSENLDAGIGKNSSYDSVVVGLAPDLFDYEHLNSAFRILKGEVSHGNKTTTGVPLIATHRAKYIQSADGMLSLGPGPFVAALENALAPGVLAQVIGKPEAAFFDMVVKDLEDFETKEKKHSRSSTKPVVAVIGDDVDADLGGGAIELGLWRVLVKTGKYRPGDESRQGVVPPNEIHESFSTFVESLLERKS